MEQRVRAVYESGHLRLLEPLDLPDRTELTVTVSVPGREDRLQLANPTRPQPLSLLDAVIGTVPAGGDALKESEALYDSDW